MKKPKCSSCGSNLLYSELKEYKEKEMINVIKGIFTAPTILCYNCKKKSEDTKQ